jgi:hypothetical protein
MAAGAGSGHLADASLTELLASTVPGMSCFRGSGTAVVSFIIPSGIQLGWTRLTVVSSPLPIAFAPDAVAVTVEAVGV